MDEIKDLVESTKATEPADILDEAVEYLKVLKNGAGTELGARLLAIRHDLKLPEAREEIKTSTVIIQNQHR
jgi:hypothetical protein